MATSSSLKYSVLELASVPAGGGPADSFQNMVKLAQAAESFGYERFWLAEHHNMISIASSAPPILIGHVASHTSRIRVGSGGVMLPNHSPLVVSEQFGTLANLYPGRIDMGLGRAPGTDQVTAAAIRSDRQHSVYQFPDEIRQIQQYFSSSNSTSRVRATVAEGVDVPIYILGSSTDSAHLAAAMGLPYAFASHFAPAELFRALNIYHNEFQPSERLSKPYTIACVNVIAADTDAEAEALSTSMIRMMLSVFSGKPDYLQPATEMTPELRAIFSDPGMQRMVKYSLVGSKETVRDKVAEFIDQTAVNELMVASHVYDQDARIKSYRLLSEIVRELQQAPAAVEGF